MSGLSGRSGYLFAILLTAAYCSAFAKGGPWEKLNIPPIDWKPPAFQQFELTNGISGILVNDNEVPMAEFYILFPASPDPEGRAGLAEIATYVLRNGGSVNLNADSLNALIEYKAASLSIGESGGERIWIYGSCLKSDLKIMLDVVAELIRNPAYPEAQIELKRGTMLEAVKRRNDDPYGIAYREFFRLMYPGHPVGREASAGSIAAITRAELEAFHHAVFQPEGVVIGFAGDVELSVAQSVAESSLGWLKPTKQNEKIPPAPAPAEPGVYYGFKDVHQAYLMFGHQTVAYTDPRRHAATIMNYILGGGGFQSLLTKRVRVDEGLAYGVGSSFSTPYMYIGTFRIGASTRNEQAGRAMAIIMEELKGYAEMGPTEEQFNNAKEAYVNSIVWTFESSQDMLSNLVYNKWRGLPLDTPQRDLAAYQALTLPEVQRAAEELLHPDRLVRVVIGNRAKFDRQLEDFGQVRELNLSEE